jgi:nitrite reductase/ring-hydroxylating ferredoxin subunit
MLSKAENELITLVSAGTPMGEFMRRYWLPALLSEEIASPDAPPVQVRMLGEDLVAFRDSLGRVGLLDEHCAHRGTSLFYGRNEDCGLRCVYHGWKYDVEGNVLDTPAEGEQSTFRERIHQQAYPCVESAGMVWAYLGPPELQPLFPAYEFTQLPLQNTYVTKSLLECNWLQGLEGECDSAHLTYLHRQFDEAGERMQALWMQPPVYDIEETDFGLRLLAFRHPSPGQTYLRVSSFVTPVTVWVPVGNKEVHIYVPFDDEHAWRYDLGFYNDRAVRPEDIHRGSEIGPDYRRLRTQANHYLQDREAQRTHSYTGIENFLNHDACATETMGSIYDRSHEHLGVSDKAVIAVRRYLLDAIRRFREGEDPPHLTSDPARNNPTNVDTIARVIPSDGDWHRHFPHLSYAAGELGSEPVSAG